MVDKIYVVKNYYDNTIGRVFINKEKAETYVAYNNDFILLEFDNSDQYDIVYTKYLHARMSLANMDNPFNFEIVTTNSLDSMPTVEGFSFFSNCLKIIIKLNDKHKVADIERECKNILNNLYQEIKNKKQNENFNDYEIKDWLKTYKLLINETHLSHWKIYNK